MIYIEILYLTDDLLKNFRNCFQDKNFPALFWGNNKVCTNRISTHLWCPVHIYFGVHCINKYLCIYLYITAQKMKFSIKDFFSKCDQIRSSMQQKLFQIFFTTRSWSFWKKKHRKGTAKATLKTEKICILYIYREYLFYLQSNGSSSFLRKCINFVERRLKFSHFEGRIIP